MRVYSRVVASPLLHEDRIRHLRSVTSRFAGAIGTADPGVPVASCPGWNVSDLVCHLGSVHAWATTAVLEARNDDSDPPRPVDGSLEGWYRRHAERLVAAIERTPLDAEVWAFCPPPRTVAFWSRRQTHETTVHLWDLETAAGELGPDIEPTVAADGLDEVITMFYPRQIRLGRMPPLTHSLELIGSDDEGRWVFGPEGAPDARVTGPAAALYLLVWGRIHLDHPDLIVEGDSAAARVVLDARITP